MQLLRVCPDLCPDLMKFQLEGMYTKRTLCHEYSTDSDSCQFCVAIVFTAGRRAGGHYLKIFICARNVHSSDCSCNCNRQWDWIRFSFGLGMWSMHFNATWDVEQYANQELGGIKQKIVWQKMAKRSMLLSVIFITFKTSNQFKKHSLQALSNFSTLSCPLSRPL